ncbi:hypothetical protein HRI_002093400 [Hibiscus trionum]|uniref:Uncharacterized protein n=1 Tax=Hibiscus trionum TaxID=183268 RepID=A0A9W7HVP4_HIBTR|nr:hypothetical protein HRI_002093400 [Hibiscus trionum]
MSRYYCQRGNLVQKCDRGWDIYGHLQYSWIWVQNFKQSSYHAMLLLSIHCWRLWSSSVLHYSYLCGIIVVLLILMNPSLGVMLIGAVQPLLDCFVADFDWSAAV